MFVTNQLHGDTYYKGERATLWLTAEHIRSSFMERITSSFPETWLVTFVIRGWFGSQTIIPEKISLECVLFGFDAGVAQHSEYITGWTVQGSISIGERDFSVLHDV